jgi:hypothetical protein
MWKKMVVECGLCPVDGRGNGAIKKYFGNTLGGRLGLSTGLPAGPIRRSLDGL